MITAEAARSITESSIASSRDSLPFKYAIEQVEIYVKDGRWSWQEKFFLQC